VAAGDLVHYRIELPEGASAPLRVDAELLYQSIGYRWAENLRGYDSEETRRFVRYYSQSAAASAERLATATLAVR
jgi:hypothetical protein